MKLNILVGGKAGQGPNILADLVSRALVAKGFSVFNSREYGSFIRGGHNYNLVSVSDEPIASNHERVDILVCLDENTGKIHESELNKKAIILKCCQRNNMFYAGSLFKILGLDFRVLENELRHLKKNFDQNMRDARAGFETEKKQLVVLPNIAFNKQQTLAFTSGSEAIAKSSADFGGLEYYYSYPMTPATPLAMDLSAIQSATKGKVRTIELESEIAVVNAALGSSIAGSISACGTSGGGFDLMTEALSLAGQAEIPIVVYLAQRPGPSTGMPTYTGQGDLNLARHAGHGEFARVVLTPGDSKESIESASYAFCLSQKYKTPVILLGDKHLAESKYTFVNNPKTITSEKIASVLKKFNSYEHDKEGIATEDEKIINANFKRRLLEKQKKIQEEIDTSKEIISYKTHGKKDSKNLVVSWGSTKGAILDAITYSKIDAKFLQLLVVEPFPSKAVSEIKNHKDRNRIFVAESNATSQLSQLIAEKTGIIIDDKNKILKYDGRAFTSDEIARELKKRGVK